MLNKLDYAMMYNLLQAEKSLTRTIHIYHIDICEGIAQSAYWLDLITSDDYLAISRTLTNYAERIRTNA